MTEIKKDLIYLFEDIVDVDICDRILEFYNNNFTNDINDTSKLPWFEDNTYYWNHLQNLEIGGDVELCRDIMLDACNLSYNKECFPNTTTLVMWKPGKSMAAHRDNGYEDDKDDFFMREYTGVLYINDDYMGGETFILKEGSTEEEINYKPKKASLLLFKSDDTCVHGVKRVLSGNRLTLSMWFTLDQKYEELS